MGRGVIVRPRRGLNVRVRGPKSRTLPLYHAGATEPPEVHDEQTNEDVKPKKSKREMTYEEKKREQKNRQQGVTEEDEKPEDEVETEKIEEKKEETAEVKKNKKNQAEREIESGSAIFVKNQ
uniref:Hva1_TUDOR domain-containing protein n=1 Tax=Caenorhabditis tropicalis TaxID=1561998 RepID=A0A1I7V3T3_9PELO